MSISVRRPFVIATLLCLLGAWPAAAADAPAAPRLAVIDEPAGAALRVLDQAGTLPFQVAVCVAGASPADPALDARLTALDKRRVPVWLVDRGAGMPSRTSPSWQTALHALLEKHGDSLAILEVLVDRQPARLASFALEIAATEARANREAIRIAIGGPAMADRARREEIYRPQLAPYVDLLDVPDSTAPRCRRRVAAADRPGRRHRRWRLARCGAAPGRRKRGSHDRRRARRAGQRCDDARVAGDRWHGGRAPCARARAGPADRRDFQS